MSPVLMFIIAAVPYVIAFIVLLTIWKSVVLVSGTEIAIVERKYIGKKMPEGRVIAQANEIGIQARTLAPGLHFLIPYVYKAMKYPFTVIAENEVGIVESIDGDPIPPGKIFAKVVQGHRCVSGRGTLPQEWRTKGPADRFASSRYVPHQSGAVPREEQKQLTFIDKGKIGIVTSMDGEPIPPGRLLAPCHLRGEALVGMPDGDGWVHIDSDAKARALLDVPWRSMRRTTRVTTSTYFMACGSGCCRSAR